MPTDATGTPTSLGIRKYNTSADAPSGLGFNGAMDDIDALLKNLGIASLTANDVPVFDSVAGKFKKATGTPSSSTYLRGDGSWAAVAAGPSAPATTLPGFPTDGQQAILTDSTTVPTYEWLMQWSAAASKWIFIGGSSWLKNYASGGVINTLGVQPVATWYTDSGTVYTIPRTGTYHVRWAADINRNGGGNGAAQSAVYKNTALVSNTSNAKIENLYNNNDTMPGEWAITANAGDTVGVVVSGAAVGTWVLTWKTVEITPVTVT